MTEGFKFQKGDQIMDKERLGVWKVLSRLFDVDTQKRMYTVVSGPIQQTVMADSLETYCVRVKAE